MVHKNKIDNVVFVTSFSEKGYEKYGRKFLDSFIKFFPKEARLNCFYHSEYGAKTLWEPTDLPADPRVTYVPLDALPEMIPFKDNAANLLEKKMGLRYTKNVPWRLDVIKWVNKVFAIANANAHHANTKDAEWLVWIDADSFATREITKRRILSWLPEKADVVHLGRRSTNYSETSFLGFHVKGGEGSAVRFIDDLVAVFISGEFQNYAEWHDGFIFERLLYLSKRHGLKAYDLSNNTPLLEAFQTSELGMYFTHLKGGLKDGVVSQQTAPAGRAPFKVNPYDCVEQKELIDNIVANSELIDSWVTYGKPDEETKGIFVSAGPSLKKRLPEIKEAQQKGAIVFCVKHAYPTLLAAGIEPDFCVLIDPRPFEGTSTHGVIRSTLFDTISPKTTFLIASMTHPSVTTGIMARGGRVAGWHAYSAEYAKVAVHYPKELSKFTFAIPIGTCAAVRGIGLARVMGIKQLDLYGYDCSLVEKPEVLTDKHVRVSLFEGNAQPHIVTSDTPPHAGETLFWSTGELVAMYQDVLAIVPTLKSEIDITFKADEDTLLGKGWAIRERLTKAQEDGFKKQEESGMLLSDFIKKPPKVSLGLSDEVKAQLAE